MRNIIQIINVEKLAGKSKSTGNDYDMRFAQCIVERTDPETGEARPLIGELMLPEKFKDTPPGRYEVVFDIVVQRDKRIGSVVASITPIPSQARAAAPAPAAAAKA